MHSKDPFYTIMVKGNVSGTVGGLSQGRGDCLRFMTSGHLKSSIVMHLTSFGRA